MAEHDWLTLAPVLVKDFGAVLGRDHGHGKFLWISSSFRGDAKRRTPDVQLHIGESRGSGFALTRAPERRGYFKPAGSAARRRRSSARRTPARRPAPRRIPVPLAG